MKNKYETYRAILREKLDEYRYVHSINVSETSAELARKYGADEKKAYEAGLLHDIMKNADKEETFALFEKYGVELTQLEKKSPKLWHAIAGSVYCKYELEIDDEDVISAIRYHTTGRAGMTELEKVLFTADFISADRNYNGVEEMREKAQISLDEAMTEGLRFTIDELCNALKPIHPDTIDAYNDILLKGIE
ncbi:MAG: bis(5'-nucleosyl)-tetraphosphatase (symmetrical) YqeK [Oscillospiraceae bacterium]|nr:bis(5'-nucleosyl)-tetraphosphatase (symmetrical) YqeK [Oscillospiraceae bacterium]MDD7353545.1 bis(5'-nucleosyl)-tetraphosphatase (symmetrical) YqeK [Oscillospiraceae bacterium]MDY3937178.1 bis(5'-nucleosyl)-tetraphosphatase (symmetrical) YqeK [Oscillospiraceae bacterium]